MNENINQDLEFYEVGLLRLPMQILGIWPYGKYRHVIFSITIILLLVVTVPATKSFSTELTNEGIHRGCLLLLFVFAINKLMLFNSNEKQMRAIIVGMRSNWKQADCFQSDRKTIIINDMRKTRNIVLTWLITTIVVNIGTIPAPWITSHIKGKSVQLYLQTWHPFNKTESPLFEIMFTGQFIVIVYLPLIYFSIHALPITTIRHCRTQLLILCDIVKNYDGSIRHDSPNNSEDIGGFSRSEYECYCIKCIVEKHLKIIEFFRLIQNKMYLILSLDIAAVQLLLCIMVVMFVEPLGKDPNIYLLLIFLYVIWLLIFTLVYCWICETLTQASLNVADAIYNSKWYDLSNKNTRSLLPIMIYSHNYPITMRFGLLYTMRNELFKDIILLTYSVFSVSRGFNSKRVV